VIIASFESIVNSIVALISITVNYVFLTILSFVFNINIMVSTNLNQQYL